MNGSNITGRDHAVSLTFDLFYSFGVPLLDISGVLHRWLEETGP